MKFQGRVPLLMTLVASVAVSACASNGKTGALIGGGVGCALGAMVAKSTGADPRAGCAAGAVVGAGFGYYAGRQKDLELAQAAARDIRALNTGFEVHLNTRKQDVPEDKRKEVSGARSIEVVDSMVVAVPQNLVAKQDARAVTTLSKVGGYVSQSSTKSNVVVNARSKQEYDFMVAAMQKGYQSNDAGDKVTFTYHPANARATQATVEVRPAETSVA